jgi:hypothetical protein
MEAVEWGTCQDKSMQLAAAGDPPDVAYMGSRTLRQLAKNDLIVPVTFTPEEEAAFQPRATAPRPPGASSRLSVTTGIRPRPGGTDPTTRPAR